MLMDSQLCSIAPQPTSVPLSPRVTPGRGGGGGGEGEGWGWECWSRPGQQPTRKDSLEAACGQEREGGKGWGLRSPHYEARITKHTSQKGRVQVMSSHREARPRINICSRHRRAVAICPQSSWQLLCSLLLQLPPLCPEEHAAGGATSQCVHSLVSLGSKSVYITLSPTRSLVTTFTSILMINLK